MRQKKFFRLWFSGITMLGIISVASAQTFNPGHKIGTLTGVYNFSYNQTPAQLVELYPAAIPNTGLTYSWEQSSSPTSGFVAASGTNNLSSYTFSGPLTQTTYFRRRSSLSLTQFIYSNTIKITVGSVNWEDINYLREHDVFTTGITTWTGVDQLSIGQKLQSTTYFDGAGRPIEKVNRETATPPSNPNDLWGDIVQFFQYDVYGREPVTYLPYSTTTQSGKFKTTQLTEQPQYYTNSYNETSAFSSITYENSPLNRVTNIKQPGTAWAAANGVSATYEVNTTTDNVQNFAVDYTQGNAPIYIGVYPANRLYKFTHIDENGKKIIEFSNTSGQLILKKVQLDDNPASSYDGWVCTYYIYDDFGLLRYEIQPEGVKYLSNNSWSFAGVNGQMILAEQCYQYYYDDKARLTWKKAPGSVALNMIYDIRDRVVFMQDGNQAALSTPQWTANLYDELDRSVITTLYNTSKTIATLKSDLSNASAVTSITISNPGNNGGGSPITVATSLDPITATDLNNSTITVVLDYRFYDNYSFSGVKTFDNNYNNLSAYSTSDPNVVPIATSLRTLSMPTGNQTRVLGTNTFLAATLYYDERGEHIQTLEDNIKSGIDITTSQYHFDRRLLSSCSDHTTPGTGYTSFKMLTKYIFDKLGRVTSIQKQIGTNAFKTVSSYDYDDAGRMKTKHLDPNYTAGGNSGLESLNYSFNIHNQLTGINKDYALKNPANYDKWGHFFGTFLGYDNRDNIFSNANLTGQITGQIWNTQGDDAQRRYNYTYDNTGRLVIAAYTEKQHAGDTWSSTQMDFSVKGTNGKITYDLNGNLLNLLQRGVLPGSGTPMDIDNLTYTYASYSNKLQTVTDQMANSAVNGQFGDFKDGTNTVGTPDYVYDNNGNVVIDLNKNAKDLAGVVGANGIKYNFLDKPEQIRIAGKGTIQIVYNAFGEKLQRSFTPEPSGATITTSYIKQFTYQETSGGGGATLQFINFEEGRIRVISSTSQDNGLDALSVDGNLDLPNGKRGTYDFYVRDHLENVRMILTEETHYAKNTCTMETSRAALEESIFGQAGAGNEVATTRYSTSSTGWSGNTSSSVSRTGTNSGHNVGPNTLQKVLAGDKVTATVNYYYSALPGGNSSNIPTAVLGSLAQAISGGNAATNLVKSNVSAITSQLGSTTGFINAVQPNGSAPGGNTPQAFLTILFFDERFNFISAADGGVAQQQVAASVGTNGAPLGLSNIRAPKNGYAFIYVSNQSNNDVYFDDLAVGINTGNIAEENHYYAYGLKITTLCSKKLGDTFEGNLKNNFLYQGSFSEMDDDIGWDDFSLRNYDPQIGRWAQQDPYQQFPSPYIGMADDPVDYSDPTGGIIGIPCPGTSALSIFLDNVGYAISSFMMSASPILSKVSLAVTITNTAAHVEQVIQLSSIINKSVTTEQAGKIVRGGDAPPSEESESDPNIKIASVRNAFNNPTKTPVQYTVVLYTKQPVPGDRNMKASPNPNNLVGHAFIRLTIKYSDKTEVSRTFGYYPSGKGGDCFRPQAEGSTFKNNENHDWDERLTKEITKDQFDKILDLATLYEMQAYNLINLNCSTFVVGAASISGIDISGSGTFPIFVVIRSPIPFLIPDIVVPVWVRGANPASLGQDMLEGKFKNNDPSHPIKNETNPKNILPYRF